MTDNIQEGLPKEKKLRCFIENLFHTFCQGPINFDTWLHSSDALIVWERYLHRRYVWTPITYPIKIRYRPWYKCITGQSY